MSYNKLIELMNAQKNKLNELLKILKLMQQSIVNQEYDNYQQTIDMHQKILSDIRNIEKERTKLLKSLLGDNQNYSKNNLPDLIFNTLRIKDNKEKENYLNLRNEIAELIKDVTRYNFQNMYLIEHSRKFIKDLVVTLYGSKNQRILDKKA
jgi:flagellar biosynthesis/type III secretory pathway chaperone